MGGSSKKRPDNWSKEFVLDLLGSGDRSVKDHLRIVAGPLGISYRTLYRDVHDWRKSDPEFSAEYDVLVDSLSTTAGRSGGRPRTANVPHKLAAFLTDFARHGNISQAADIAGFEPGLIYRLTDPNHADFDKDFAREYEMAYQNLLARSHDIFPEVMFDKDQDARTRVWAAARFLERRDRKRFGRRVDVEVSGSVDHRRQLPDEERKQILEEAFDGFFRRAARARRIGAGGIVDAEVVEVSE